MKPYAGQPIVMRSSGAAKLIIAGLAVAWPFAAVGGSPKQSYGPHIAPKPDQKIADRKFEGTYRLFDDKQGLASGSTFERIRAVVDRGGFRIRGDAHDVVLRDITLELREPTNAPELPAGIEIQGTAHDILIDRVVARNFKMVPRPKKYTNGDGFSSERQATRITFRKSKAFDNSDGGFDLKSTETRLEDTEATRNGINYRLWGQGEATTIKSESPRTAHLQVKPTTDWHIGTLIAKSDGTAPLIQVQGSGRLKIDRCVLDVPPGTKILKIENSATPDIELGDTCRLDAPGPQKTTKNLPNR